MTPHQRLLAQKFFELEVRRNKGMEYQYLLNSVLSKAFSDFVPIRPYGNVGDRKNDGYVPSCGMYFQVYAPNLLEKNEATAAAKAQADFAALNQHALSEGRPIVEFRFAINDEYRGSVIPLESALASIQRVHGVTAKSFLAKDLEGLALSLPYELIQDILGTIIPDAGLNPDADYSAVRDVVQHVMAVQVAPGFPGRLIAPDFDDKIRVNGLSRNVADLLRGAAYQADVVTDYFSKRSGPHRQALRDHLAAIYLREQTALGTGYDPDVLFLALLRAITPPKGSLQNAVQTAALVLIAYYFEACDVFESPVNVAT